MASPSQDGYSNYYGDFPYNTVGGSRHATDSRKTKDLEVSLPLSVDAAGDLITHIEQVRLILHNYVQHTTQVYGQVPRRKSWWGRHCFPSKRRFLYRFVTIITIVLQFINLTVLTIIDRWPRRDTEESDFLTASSVTMIILQVLNLILLILASGRLAKQIYRHSVNRIFLAQNYFATILLFAGIYTLTFRLKKHSWKFVSEDLNSDPSQVFILYAKFLFYSISTATLCGSDNVLPVDWYNSIFAAIQMLLSFCYFASILGAALGQEGDTKSSKELTTSSRHKKNQRQQRYNNDDDDVNINIKHHQHNDSAMGQENRSFNHQAPNGSSGGVDRGGRGTIDDPPNQDYDTSDWSDTSTHVTSGDDRSDVVTSRITSRGHVSFDTRHAHSSSAPSDFVSVKSPTIQCYTSRPNSNFVSQGHNGTSSRYPHSLSVDAVVHNACLNAVARMEKNKESDDSDVLAP